MIRSIVIFTLLFSVSLKAQHQKDSIQKSNQLEFSAGYTFGVLKNLAFAPVIRYDYNAVNYQFRYTRITKRNKLFEVQLNYVDSNLETTIIPEPNPQYSKISLNFSSLKRVLNQTKLSIHLGLQTQTAVASYQNWKLYDFHQKLGVASRFTYKINTKHSLSSKITLPFLLWRTSSFEESFYSLGTYQSILWNTEYSYQLSERFDIKANYSFNYDRIQIPSAYRELQYQINLGINFKF
ncbi:hypothetical protein [Kordia sp.]|uniref:hypothetical protein n=1 Tax=Kordia sp. TaxID=1965332 RepID=UPI003B5B1E59